MNAGYHFFRQRRKLLLELAERRKQARGLEKLERKRGMNAAEEDFQIRVLRMYSRSFRKSPAATKATETEP